MTIDSGGEVGADTPLVPDADGHPVISYYDNTNTGLKLGRCSDPYCTLKMLTTVDDFGSTGVRTSPLLDVPGCPVISHQHSGSADLKPAALVD